MFTGALAQGPTRGPLVLGAIYFQRWSKPLLEDKVLGLVERALAGCIGVSSAAEGKGFMAVHQPGRSEQPGPVSSHSFLSSPPHPGGDRLASRRNSHDQGGQPPPRAHAVR